MLEQVNHQLGRAWDALRRLEHEGVAESDAQRVHPKWDHSREVVRSDSRHNTKRRAVRVDIDTISHILRTLTLGKRGKAASVLNNFVAAENITSGVDKRLAVLLRDESGELIRVLLEELLVLEHVADTLRDGNHRPRLESIFGVSDGLVELTLRREGNLGDDILSQGALDVEALSGLRLNPAAVDVVFVLVRKQFGKYMGMILSMERYALLTTLLKPRLPWESIS